jgi:Domain of Unknown Function (DUF1080)
MKIYLLIPGFLLFNIQANLQAQVRQKVISLFDGKTFTGWEGDTVNTWHIIDNALVGGSLVKTVEHNEFLSTVETYGDFELTLQFKLEGTGFVNAGVQFHSERLKEPAYEMIGYQADLGVGFWASLYDESRRNVAIVKADTGLIKKILKPNTWNNYKIRSAGRNIIIWLNGVQTVDYTEPDEKIIHNGHIGLQVHGGGKVKASYRNISIMEL